ALRGLVSVSLVNGVATFSGLTIDNPGNGYTLRATCSSLTPAITNAINVTPLGVATQLVVTTQPPASLTAGDRFGMVVEAQDGFGTRDTSFNGTVSITDPSDGGVLAQVSAVNGVATFTNLTLNLAGDVTLPILSDGLAQAVTDGFVVSAKPATQLTFI